MRHAASIARSLGSARNGAIQGAARVAKVRACTQRLSVRPHSTTRASGRAFSGPYRQRPEGISHGERICRRVGRAADADRRRQLHRPHRFGSRIPIPNPGRVAWSELVIQATTDPLWRFHRGGSDLIRRENRRGVRLPRREWRRKTTAMRMLIGLLNPTSGTARVAGHDAHTKAKPSSGASAT